MSIWVPPVGNRPGRDSVGSWIFPRLLRGHVNRLARLAKAAVCGRRIPHGHCGGARGPASFHARSACRFSRCIVWRMWGADTGFACCTFYPRPFGLLPPQIFEAPSLMTTRDPAMAALFLYSYIGCMLWRSSRGRPLNAPAAFIHLVWLMLPVRVRFAEYLLAISAIVVTYLGAEAAFSLVGLSYVPLRLQGNLPEDIRIFAQSSKAGVVPRDPVLLLGDSHAQGIGDWLLETNPNRNGAFHSAHIINWLSGRDVVTLGRGAQAPLRAWRPSRPLPMPTRSTHGMCVFHRRTSRSSTFTKVTT